MKKGKTEFFCQNCGYASPKWLGRCPSCGEWNRFVEEEVRDDGAPSLAAELHFSEQPLPVNDIPAQEKERLATGMEEIDRVLGGGIVGG
ncbi:MAG: DNA repair protein RadA, partial [Syntrophales bacterium]|nr:DNA repair protein RadA [Syntrophales bacterium]